MLRTVLHSSGICNNTLYFASHVVVCTEALPTSPTAHNYRHHLTGFCGQDRHFASPASPASPSSMPPGPQLAQLRAREAPYHIDVGVNIAHVFFINPSCHRPCHHLLRQDHDAHRMRTARNPSVPSTVASSSPWKFDSLSKLNKFAPPTLPLPLSQDGATTRIGSPPIPSNMTFTKSMVLRY